jgi:hypothetical protein
MPGFVVGPRKAGGPAPCPSRCDFYREEIVRHCRCLQQQREYFSEGAITSLEAALTRLMARLDQLSRKEDADQVVSRLLRKIDVVTGLSYWTDSKTSH